MIAEILTIGDELCRGEIVNTNASWLGQELWRQQVTVAWMTSCRDDEVDLRTALATACDRADIVICSGGLGPTLDDLTTDVAAALTQTTTTIHEPSKAVMLARYERANYPMTENSLRQVTVPRGARVYNNSVGLAPGYEVVVSGSPVVCLPGPPRELKAIYAEHVAPRIAVLQKAAGERVPAIAYRVFRAFGTGESRLAAKLGGVCDGVDGASLHYQVKYPETLIKVAVRDSERARAESTLETIATDVYSRIGKYIYGTGDDSLPTVVGKALRARERRVATAESCTGGLVGSLITDVPGSSEYYLGGAVVYSNEEKIRQLGVAPETLSQHGAVSEECVRELAANCRSRFGADYAVSLSGIAGPGGGTADKPVGTVWLALAGPDGIETRLLNWPGSRTQVRTLAAYMALSMLLRALKKTD